jgi:hypothetical protein
MLLQESSSQKFIDSKDFYKANFPGLSDQDFRKALAARYGHYNHLKKEPKNSWNDFSNKCKKICDGLFTALWIRNEEELVKKITGQPSLVGKNVVNSLSGFLGEDGPYSNKSAKGFVPSDTLESRKLGMSPSSRAKREESEYHRKILTKSAVKPYGDRKTESGEGEPTSSYGIFVKNGAESTLQPTTKCDSIQQKLPSNGLSSRIEDISDHKPDSKIPEDFLPFNVDKELFQTPGEKGGPIKNRSEVNPGTNAQSGSGLRMKKDLTPKSAASLITQTPKDYTNGKKGGTFGLEQLNKKTTSVAVTPFNSNDIKFKSDIIIHRKLVQSSPNSGELEKPMSSTESEFYATGFHSRDLADKIQPSDSQTQNPTIPRKINNFLAKTNELTESRPDLTQECGSEISQGQFRVRTSKPGASPGTHIHYDFFKKPYCERLTKPRTNHSDLEDFHIGTQKLTLRKPTKSLDSPIDHR